MGQELPSSIVEMEYQNHLLTLETTLGLDGTGGFVPETKTAYSHTIFDKQETVESYEWDFSINDWFNTLSNSYEYDDLQRLSAKETVHHLQGDEERFRLTMPISKTKALPWKPVISGIYRRIIFWWTPKNITSTAAAYRLRPTFLSQFML
ncbi:MAG: hypothetical protein IPM82_26630 [Saprospiraceae bacterium]|nr:hypothetical protein [Saprospiraceae bacterium]